jgi:hypothetical protein
VTTTLEQAIKELRAYNLKHPIDLIAHGLRPTDEEYVRMVLLDNQVYRVCLTRVFMANNWLWMLSVMKPYGEENEDRARLPSQAEAEKIAAAFFPNGYTALNEGHQIITRTCLKFITTEAKTEGGEVHGRSEKGEV